MMEKKKLNPVVFMILATVFNIVMIALIFIALIVLLAYLKAGTEMSDNLYSILSVAAFILTFVLSFFIYRKIAMKINEKYDIGVKNDRRRE